MSARSDRKEAARLQRIAWRKRWVDLMQNKVRSGTTARDSLVALAVDAADMMTANPSQKSEIERAFDEHLQSMASAIKQCATVRTA